jgi:hypothetical protein
MPVHACLYPAVRRHVHADNKHGLHINTHHKLATLLVSTHTNTNRRQLVFGHAGDPFEALVNTYVENRSKRLSARLGAGVRSSLSRFGALMKKHRRTESLQSALSSVFSSSGASAGADHGSASASGGFASGLMSGLSRGRSGGLSASFAERPEALKMRQMVAGFAAAAEQMRRNLSADGSNKTGAGAMIELCSAATACRTWCYSVLCACAAGELCRV